MNHPWYVHALLVEPDQVLTHLDRMRARGVVDVTPNPWQLCLGVLRLWHRVLFRMDTVGTSPGGRVRDTRRARALHHRAVRLPFLIAERAVHPLDFTGLRSQPARLMRHLLGAHHDANQFVFDLELMTGHGTLAQLREKVARVVDGRDPRAGWLRDLAVFDGYHEQLAAAVDAALAGGPAMTDTDADDPDLTLRGAMRWCARQPATPAATAAAWRAGTFRFDSDARLGVARAEEPLLRAPLAELHRTMEAGRAFDPATLAGWTYHGTSLGLPAWIERLTWKTFAKAFVREPDGSLRGWNVRCVQRDPPAWQPRRAGGVPVTFGHFTVITGAGGAVELDYGAGGNRPLDPVGTVRDPLVALDGDAARLLGRTYVAIGGRRLPTPSYFLLERGARVEHVPTPPRYLPRGKSPSVVLGSR